MTSSLPHQEFGIDIDLAQYGFDEGHRGVHTSRTMMYRELEVVMRSVAAPRTQATVQQVIIEENIVGKSTRSGRENTATKLVHLYSFSQDAVLFRAFEYLWDLASDSRPVMAMLLACCRDTVLRSTAEPVLSVPCGEPVIKESLYQSMLKGFPSKYAESTLRSGSRNAMASWKQAGYISGRKDSVRIQAAADYLAATFAVVIAILRGERGGAILGSDWLKFLDLSQSELESALQEASRHGLLNFRRVGQVVELGFGPALTEVVK